jgi:hypothetical protein
MGAVDECAGLLCFTGIQRWARDELCVHGAPPSPHSPT